jgi:hypothetical protein
MKNGKKEIKWNKDTKKMIRRYQFVISRLQTGYTMATHGYTINKQTIRTSALSVILGCRWTKFYGTAKKQR